MTRIVLIGGGHSHAAVLRRCGMQPLARARLTLVSHDVETPYSGMLPGVIAGHYTREDAHIDLQRLARFARARAIFDDVIGLDLRNRLVHCRTRPPVPFDVLSINTGSTPNASVPGALEYAIAVKPIDRFLAKWEALQERLLAGDAPRRIAVVGGGAGGVELLLAVQFAIARKRAAMGRSDRCIEYHLVTASESILPTHNARARRMFLDILADRRVTVHTGCRIVAVHPRRLETEGGAYIDVDEILWTTEARAPSWIAASGLDTDEAGFVRVNACLQSTSHPHVFAAGDVASIVGRRLEKSGVYAVRQGPVLAANLRRYAAGKRLRAYRPQRQFLSLISTGDRFAVAARGPFAAQGRWVWRWKDAIDRRFMRRYTQLPPMAEEAPPVMEMRCGGCGAKVGASTLARALARVPRVERPDVLVGLDEPDDAAIVAAPACRASVHTVDFFRALVDDPYVFGQIAATHALGDLYAMGAQPHTALAIATLPHGPEDEIEDTLAAMLGGAATVLGDAGAALVGGHTSEGAELALGFALNGLVDRDRVLRKGGLRPGDRLVLTKAVGTGALFAADMRHEARGRWIKSALASMLHSNREAAEILRRSGATACTDVTGFGLAGHLLEMLAASETGAEIALDSVPLLEGAEACVRAGFVSTMQPENERASALVQAAPEVATSPRFRLLFDPQTSGGLLAGVPADRAEASLNELRAAGYERAAIVGTVEQRRTDGTRIVVV